ncbi:META domain-containing protein [Pontibacter liquoris]|uniref:META domain-containing protein n=1 Tax=Pontibacter liquoris TaxID=2905677 RepID=UPI001FA70302|nr:META domain-containing protein [Pontibacter liquoris]
MPSSRFILASFLSLLLLAGGCTVKPVNADAEAETIRDAYWMLLSVEGMSPQAPNNTHTAYIRFEENENDVHGFAGCNKFTGKYKADEDTHKLQLSALSSTKMMCPDMDLENKLLQELQRVDTYSLAGDILTLYAGGKAVAMFRTGNEHEVTDVVEGGLH